MLDTVTNLKSLLNDPGLRATWGHNGRERWRQNFRWEVQAAAYEETIIDRPHAI